LARDIVGQRQEGKGERVINRGKRNRLFTDKRGVGGSRGSHLVNLRNYLGLRGGKLQESSSVLQNSKWEPTLSQGQKKTG